MKKICFLSVIILFASISQLTAYKSIFGNDTLKWSVYHEIPDLGRTKIFFSHSDTNINSIQYHIMNYLDFWNPTINDFHYSEVCGFISEDTVKGIYKILIETRVDMKIVWREFPIMDLSLNKNDTFLIITDLRDMRADTAIVDSVYYENNRKIVELNKYHLSIRSHYEQKIKFIEGIGLSIGFPINDFFEYYGLILLCKFNNDILEYSTPDNINGDCHLAFIDVKDKFSNNQINIYPNPANEELRIHLNVEFDTISLIKIMDIFGNLLYSESYFFSKGGEKIIDLSKFPNGIYFIQVIYENEVIIKKISLIK